MIKKKIALFRTEDGYYEEDGETGGSASQGSKYLPVCKQILGVNDDSKDDLLNIYIDSAMQSILNYCNLSEFPSELDYALCDIVCDAYRENSAQNAVGEVVGNVSSISEDGRSVSFAKASEARRTVDARVLRTTELNRFKKLYRL